MSEKIHLFAKTYLEIIEDTCKVVQIALKNSNAMLRTRSEEYIRKSYMSRLYLYCSKLLLQ